ncbi:MAG: hypothetical protein KI786_15990, partial [Mameliella sp.]|nr:hypothetical protein [Phaeodactylibacter sp.]
MRDLILTLFCALLTALTVQAQCTLELNAVNITHPVCPAESTGSIVLEATGGTPPYQYLWSNGFTGAGQGFLQAGTYSITLVDADGCTLEQVYELVPSLIADAGPDQTIYCGGAVEIGTLPADPGRIWLDGSAVPVRFEQENGTLLEFGFTNAYVGTNIPIPNPPNNPDAVKLAIESAQAQPGDQICLPVTAEQFTGLAAFSFTLNYDNNYLQLNAIQQLNEDIPGFDLSAHFTEVEGAIEVSWAENNSGLAT